MDQSKIGNYLKELRKQKGLTQEELSEKLGVSRRSVSRWETGSNLPDLDILIELSDFYDVDLKCMLAGNTEETPMDKEIKETALIVAEYSNEEKLKVAKRFHYLYLFAAVAFAIYLATIFIDALSAYEGVFWYDFLQGMTLGITFGMLIVGFIFTGANAHKLREAKLRMFKKLTGKQ